MPGAFAHITLAKSLAGDLDALDAISSLTDEMKGALSITTQYCELGAVSPDYAYLTPGHDHTKAWSDVMHYWHTAGFIREGVRLLASKKQNPADRAICMTWLFGYTTHVVADLTIHPVIGSSGWDFATHSLEHRICELNQDAYIVKAKNREEIGTREYSALSGIGACGDPANPKRLHRAIRELWTAILTAITTAGVHFDNGVAAPSAPPDPNEWHEWYLNVINLAARGRNLPPLSRHFAEAQGLAYPPYAECDRTYLDRLQTPIGTFVTYEDVFQKARQNALSAWAALAAAFNAGEPELFTLPDGDLDTGLDANHASVYWKSAAEYA